MNCETISKLSDAELQKCIEINNQFVDSFLAARADLEAERSRRAALKPQASARMFPHSFTTLEPRDG